MQSPGVFDDSQIRTLQRRVKHWRALEGPGQEIFFPQIYRPGELWRIGFHAHGVPGVTIGGSRFDHLVYHFVLPYSNWEDGTICFSETFESLSEGLQNALWELGGVPAEHRPTGSAQRCTSSPPCRSSPPATTPCFGHYGLVGREDQRREPARER